MFAGSDAYKRVLLLQVRRFRPVLYISLDGPLGQKNRTRTQDLVEDLKSQITKSLSDFRWSSVPRAKMAVSMTFFASKRQPPAIQNLVKFYLDELQSHAFRDDRQVACIEAEMWRHTSGEAEASDRVYIKVERLADYKRRFDAAFALEWELGLQPDQDFDPDNELDPDAFVGLFSPEQIEALRVMTSGRRQHVLLGLNRIEAEDRPGLRRKGVIGATTPHVLDLPRPFVINVGNLPQVGGTKAYKQQIRSNLIAFKERYPRLRALSRPVVLDVAVSARGPHVNKDLDNIMRDIAPIFAEEFLVAPAYLHGYRAYVQDSLRDDLPSDSIRIKILTEDALSEYRRHQDAILEKAREEIELR